MAPGKTKAKGKPKAKVKATPSSSSPDEECRADTAPQQVVGPVSLEHECSDYVLEILDEVMQDVITSQIVKRENTKEIHYTIYHLMKIVMFTAQYQDSIRPDDPLPDLDIPNEPIASLVDRHAVGVVPRKNRPAPRNMGLLTYTKKGGLDDAARSVRSKRSGKSRTFQPLKTMKSRAKKEDPPIQIIDIPSPREDKKIAGWRIKCLDDGRFTHGRSKWGKVALVGRLMSTPYAEGLDTPPEVILPLSSIHKNEKVDRELQQYQHLRSQTFTRVKDAEAEIETPKPKTADRVRDRKSTAVVSMRDRKSTTTASVPKKPKKKEESVRYFEELEDFTPQEIPFTPAVGASTTVTSNSLVLAPGVKMNCGTTEKKGPGRAVLLRKMSKVDFKLHQLQLQSGQLPMPKTEEVMQEDTLSPSPQIIPQIYKPKAEVTLPESEENKEHMTDPNETVLPKKLTSSYSTPSLRVRQAPIKRSVISERIQQQKKLLVTQETTSKKTRPASSRTTRSYQREFPSHKPGKIKVQATKHNTWFDSFDESS